MLWGLIEGLNYEFNYTRRAAFCIPDLEGVAIWHIIVISWYECDIIVITRVRGAAEDEC